MNKDGYGNFMDGTYNEGSGYAVEGYGLGIDINPIRL